MKKILPIKGVVKPYDWGSVTAIPELLGEQPDGKPKAELWLGAHPSAPAIVEKDGKWTPLTQLIETFPEEILGSRTARMFNNSLPFLFKVLAAATPLSIQAHPDSRQAITGFERETKKGIRLDADNRNYKDGNHKSECICALTPFWALNGFRDIPSIGSMLGTICPKNLGAELNRLKNNPDPEKALKEFFKGMMTLPENRVKNIIGEAVGNAENTTTENPAFSWFLKLQGQFPGDISALSPMFLNLVRMNPGEALYLSAGRLHAYLDGVGVELMANSDNVLRGGLTRKHIDIPELMAVLLFEETVPEILTPTPISDGEKIYRTDAEEFVLSEISVDGRTQYHATEKRSVEILLCVKGSARIFGKKTDDPLAVEKGDAVIIPAAAPEYRIEGDSLFYKATVPTKKI